MPGQNHNISGQTLSEARSQWADGNYAGAWETLANAGDNYADNAAAVIGGDAYGGDLFSTLVRNHWENTVGADTY